MKKLHTHQAGIVHHIGLLVLIFVVLGVASFAGLRVWQARQSAQAASWDQIGYNFLNPGEFKVYACRVSNSLARVYVKNDSNYNLQISTGTHIATVKPNSSGGPYSSKWSGIISWNNLYNWSYSLDGTVAASSPC